MSSLSRPLRASDFNCATCDVSKKIGAFSPGALILLGELYTGSCVDNFTNVLGFRYREEEHTSARLVCGQRVRSLGHLADHDGSAISYPQKKHGMSLRTFLTICIGMICLRPETPAIIAASVKGTIPTQRDLATRQAI
jgi:hypothetical protein